MAYEREHRVDDRELDRLSEEMTRSEPEFDIPGKQTRTELVHRVTAIAAAEASRRLQRHPGKHAVSAPKLSFHDFQALALRDVLSRLGNRPELRVATLAASDPRVARRVAQRESGEHHGVDPTRASPAGRGLWQAAERRAVTLFRRASDAGAVSTRSQDVDTALAAIGSGAVLPRDVCQMMEPIFGVRLDRVRIHSGSVAQRACDAVNADAFTVGEDIFLPRWDPRSSACRELLAHELVHCVQWWQGRIGPSANRAVSRPTDVLEQEADRFVRGINFERLGRRDSSRPRSGPIHHSGADASKQPVVQMPVASLAPVWPIPVAPLIQNSPVRSTMLMRSQNGPSDEGNETWNSANWQYWKDLAASMWLPPIDEVLKRDARLMADNVWLVFGGITLTMGVAYLAIVATGIVGAAAAIATWFAFWGLPAWATIKVVSDWLEQVERVKGNEEQAKIAKEKFAQVVVTLALVLARIRKPKQAQQTTAPRTTAHVEPVAAPKQLETHVPAGNAAGAARQLPAPNVPAPSKPVPTKRGPKIRELLPAISATSSFIGPPTEQQFLAQHPMVFGSPGRGEFDEIDRPRGSAPVSHELVVKDKGGNDVAVRVDTTSQTECIILRRTDQTDVISEQKMIGYLDYKLTNNNETIQIINVKIEPEFQDQKLSRVLFDHLIRQHSDAVTISTVLTDGKNKTEFYKSLYQHLPARVRPKDVLYYEHPPNPTFGAITQEELQMAAHQALRDTPAFKVRERFGFGTIVKEESGLIFGDDGLVPTFPRLVVRRSAPLSAQQSEGLGRSDDTISPEGSSVSAHGRFTEQPVSGSTVKGGSPEAGELGQPSPDADAVKALIRNANKVLWIFDWDGTMANFNEDPAACAPTPVVLDLLQEIDSNPKYEGAIVSGRSYKDLDKWFRQFSFTLIGDHGASIREPKVGGKWTTEVVPDWIVQAKQIMNKEQYKLPEAFIEKKDFGVPWHYRAVVDQEAAKRVADALYNELRLLFADKGLLVQHDEFVIEVRDEKVNKGTAASHLFRPGQLIYFAGDAQTDEPLHAAVRKYSSDSPSITTKVGGAPSVAEFRVKNVDEHIDFLKKVIGR